MSEGSFTNLKELVGHTPFQVFVGMLLGIALASLLWLLY
jgi:acid phosphatase family membrane protein YuiD